MRIAFTPLHRLLFGESNRAPKPLSRIIECCGATLPTSNDLVDMVDDPYLAIAYISGVIGSQEITTQLHQQCRVLGVKLITIMSSGNLTSTATNQYAPSSVVIHLFSSRVIRAIDVQIIDLPVKSNDEKQQAELLSSQLSSLVFNLGQNYFNTFAYACFDGLCGIENQFIRALYASGKLKVPLIGGSAGGNNSQAWFSVDGAVQRDKCMLMLVQLGEGYSYAFNHYHNADGKELCSMRIDQCENNSRTLKTAFDPEGTIKTPVDLLCYELRCTPIQLSEKLNGCQFVVRTGEGETYVRSISNIDFEVGSISFFCDLNFGEELFLRQTSKGIAGFNSNLKHFQRSIPGKVVSALTIDGMLRRIGHKHDELAKAVIPFQTAGYSSFGETCYMHANYTNVMLAIFKKEHPQRYHDSVRTYPSRLARIIGYHKSISISDRAEMLENVDTDKGLSSSSSPQATYSNESLGARSFCV